MVFAVFALSICSIVPVVLLLQLAWRTFLLTRLPRLPPGAKLTRELLHSAARDFAPLVRLPGSHGVLVTDPTLARKLLEGGSGAVRDVSAYAKYATFLEDALVLLPQGDGGRHARLRAQLLPLFSARRAHPTLVACVERCLARLDEHARSSRAVPLYKELQDFTIDATSSSFLAGRLSDADGRRLKLLFEEWLDSPPEPPPPPPCSSLSSCSSLYFAWALCSASSMKGIGKSRKGTATKAAMSSANWMELCSGEKQILI